MLDDVKIIFMELIILSAIIMPIKNIEFSISCPNSMMKKVISYSDTNSRDAKSNHFEKPTEMIQNVVKRFNISSPMTVTTADGDLTTPERLF
jgi:hypothetical protein